MEVIGRPRRSNKDRDLVEQCVHGGAEPDRTEVHRVAWTKVLGNDIYDDGIHMTVSASPRTAKRRAAWIAGIAAIPVALVALVGVAPAANADPPQEAVRNAIAQAAVSQIGKAESGDNYYPKAYKINGNVVRPAEWCGVFTNWAWWKGGAPKRPNMAGTGIDQGHWATYWQQWGKAHHKWKPLSRKDPRKGDAVVYGNYPASVHVGVVVGVKYGANNKVTQVRTVEGNVSDKVSDLGWRKIGELTGRGHKASGFVSPV
jgi:hypothetical protein